MDDLERTLRARLAPPDLEVPESIDAAILARELGLEPKALRHLMLHDAGVYHSDLNRRNILIDGNADVWLIDFDKCDRRAPGSWTQDNLSRLHRSLAKDDQQGPMHWTPDDWHALQAGYQEQATYS